MRELRQRPGCSPLLIHTGQHFSPEMSENFFHDLSMPAPDINLEVGPGTQTEQTSEIMRRLEPAFLNAKPDAVLVVGDVNSTMAAAVVAAKLGIRVAHVEAGLRSFDRRMPEEINRVITDVLSDLLFVTEPSGRENLLAEGIPSDRIFFVGNVMIDTLLRFRDRAAASGILGQLGLSAGNYALVTLHRPSNVDDPDQLDRLLETLKIVAERIPTVFAVHPRTRARIESRSIDPGRIILVPPLGYIDFLRLMSDARLVLTDSGGIQEETTILQTSCLTLRENTERPVTITQGTNRLVGVESEAVLKAVSEVLEAPSEQRPECVPDLWDGRASIRIVDILESRL
jgi:UDP-N-acetylglucosamine 2-epimerase (non-hydrolysing)